MSTLQLSQKVGYKNMKFNERLKALRTQSAMTQAQLGELIGVSIITIRNWESGAKLPSMPAIISLSRALHASSDFILGITPDDILQMHPVNKAEAKLLADYRELDRHGRKAVETICSIEKARIIEAKHDNIVYFQEQASAPSRYIPKYTTPSAAGYSAPLDGDDFEMILVDGNVPHDADFAVVIDGNSMEPYIHDGETVYVKKNCELNVGDVGIFNVNGSIYCKQYYIDSERNLTLVSANPDLRRSNIYVNAESEATVVCFGKVILREDIPLPSYFLNEE